MKGIIYRTTCLITNDKYIGKHECDSTKFDGYLGSGVIIINAIKKYGKKNFIRQIIRIVDDDEDINELEKYYIRINDAVNRDDFYNIAEGGGADTHPCKKQNIREKMSVNHADFNGPKNPMFGKSRPDLTERNKKAQHKIVNNIKVYAIEHPDLIFNSLTEVIKKSKSLGWSGLSSVGNLYEHLTKPLNHKSCGKDVDGNKLHWLKI